MTAKLVVALPLDEGQRADLERGLDELKLPLKCVYVQQGELAAEHLEGAVALLGNPAPQLVAGSALELLQLGTAGFNGYESRGVLPEGLTVCNAVGAFGLSVGEHMLALTFALLRHLHLYRDEQLRGSWRSRGNVISLRGSTVLVLGMGDIGSYYARSVKALGAARVLGVREHADRALPEGFDAQYPLSALDTLLPQADIVAMVLPGNEQTCGLINARTLALCKRGALLINVGRGSAIVESTLIEALESGQLGAAAVDVCAQEPLPKSSPLWRCERLLITPHVAGNYFLRETLNLIVRLLLSNLRAFYAGEGLRNVVLQGEQKKG
ncbi:MAG: D-2-hydroxyacid dehydrogenase [Succinivibrio sp.]|nr:D-2-hydroxyacid dehydrogenase [Succinivibrio sp.]